MPDPDRLDELEPIDAPTGALAVVRSPDEVLAEIPGWEDARWIPLSGGLTNNTYHVKSDSAQGVLKIDDQERSEPFNARHDEAVIQSTAAAAGLAPRVLFTDSRAYLTEYVDGVVWDRQRLVTSGNLDMLAVALQRLHRLPLSGRTFDAVAAARCYSAAIGQADRDTVALCNRVIEGSPRPQGLRCCHNDLVSENMISTPDLQFLDWEYACDNDPLFDLASTVEHHELSDAQAGRFMKAYSGGDDRHTSQHLGEQRLLYLALLYLWTAQRPDSAPLELASIAARLATSCS